MADTIKTIIADCVASALGLPGDPIQTELRDVALGEYNLRARIIYDSWNWDNGKIPQFEVTADATGIITFAATVESVRALRLKEADGTIAEGTRIWNEDELIAAARGEQVGEQRFQHLNDAAGCRRAQVDIGLASKTFYVLALARFVKAIVDPAYSAATPAATPTDYRVQTFIIDRAEPSLREDIKDALRLFQGMGRAGEGAKLLNVALQRETYDSDRERRINPNNPMFGDVHDWGG